VEPKGQFTRPSKAKDGLISKSLQVNNIAKEKQRSILPKLPKESAKKEEQKTKNLSE
jgi:hypothetical protein